MKDNKNTLDLEKIFQSLIGFKTAAGHHTTPKQLAELRSIFYTGASLVFDSVVNKNRGCTMQDFAEKIEWIGDQLATFVEEERRRLEVSRTNT